MKKIKRKYYNHKNNIMKKNKYRFNCEICDYLT